MNPIQSLAIGILLTVACGRLGARVPALGVALRPPLCLLWAWIGVTFPDVDQFLPLDHRSALTHSIFPSLLLLRARSWRAPAAGLALGLGLHLAADCFPEAMTGFATVKLPLAGSIGGWSYLWLGGHAIASTALGAWLLRRAVPALLPRAAVLAATMIFATWYLLDREGSLPAALLYAGVAWTVLLPVAGTGAGAGAGAGATES